MLATATVALLWQARVQMDETDWVEHTDRVMLVAEQAKTEFLQAQTTLRGFLISLDPAQRSLVQEHWNKSQQLIGQLVALVADNPAQEQNLTALNGLENQWLEAARDVDPTYTDAQKREFAARAAAISDKVLLQFDTISAAEQELWKGRDALRDFHYRIATLVIPDRGVDPGDHTDGGGLERDSTSERYICGCAQAGRGGKSVEDEFSRRGLP